jgi:hypothetical protein
VKILELLKHRDSFFPMKYQQPYLHLHEPVKLVKKMRQEKGILDILYAEVTKYLMQYIHLFYIGIEEQHEVRERLLEKIHQQ